MAPTKKLKGAISQDKVFYTKEWTKEVEKVFVDFLIDQKKKGFYEVGRVNMHALMCASSMLNERFGMTFDHKFIIDRLRKLRKRYHVFKWMKTLSGVVYNPNGHKVEATEPTWNFIVREEKLGMAYMKGGEPLFPDLKFLFNEGPGDESENDDHEIIDIASDSDHGDNEDNGDHNNSPDPHLPLENESDNTNNSFWNELAWYNSDNASGSTIPDPENPPSKLSTTEDVLRKCNRHWAHYDWSNKGNDVDDIPNSSTASSSPFKK
ncbi:ribosome-binding factor A [Striga asiatica]|uniref:Ribosome-binding factor A n=1 Tax=Striga asiatica TaxID=4170 RepID=A0A5A7R1T8_STRAF|nr:ribosome-binding factor A [Striga asiatica]